MTRSPSWREALRGFVLVVVGSATILAFCGLLILWDEYEDQQWQIESKGP